MTDGTPSASVFLDRGSYRQRRFRDLARVVPVLGAVLIVMPLLWPRSGPEAATTGQALTYLFSIWLGLICLAFWVSRRVVEAPPDQAAAVATAAGSGGDADDR